MNTEELASKLGELYEEFEASGKSIDEFIKAKLGAARDGGQAMAAAAIRTFGAIDANYVDLQKATAAGENRQEWLRRRLDETLQEVGAEAEREKVGEFLAAAVDTLTGAKEGTTTAVPFEGIDAVDTVKALDEALALNALATLRATVGQNEQDNGTED